MNLPYSGCFTRRSTFTTTVLSVLSDTTCPTRTRFGIVLSFRLSAGALALQRLDPRDRAAHLADAARLFELAGRRLEAQVELLALQLGELLAKLVVGFRLQDRKSTRLNSSH